MSRSTCHALAGVLGAVALIVGGCASMEMPPAQPQPVPEPGAPASGFASPQTLFERYPEMRRQTL